MNTTDRIPVPGEIWTNKGTHALVRIVKVSATDVLYVPHVAYTGYGSSRGKTLPVRFFSLAFSYWTD